MMESPLRTTVTMAFAAGAGQPLTGFTRSHDVDGEFYFEAPPTKPGLRISVVFVAARYPPHWSHTQGLMVLQGWVAPLVLPHRI